MDIFKVLVFVYQLWNTPLRQLCDQWRIHINVAFWVFFRGRVFSVMVQKALFYTIPSAPQVSHDCFSCDCRAIYSRTLVCRPSFVPVWLLRISNTSHLLVQSDAAEIIAGDFCYWWVRQALNSSFILLLWSWFQYVKMLIGWRGRGDVCMILNMNLKVCSHWVVNKWKECIATFGESLCSIPATFDNSPCTLIGLFIRYTFLVPAWTSICL